jgi:hypothetical protein
MSQIGARSAYLALRDFDPANVSCGQPGSISAAEFSDRHGRTCFNTGRQGTAIGVRFLIDEMTASIIGKRGARS